MADIQNIDYIFLRVFLIIEIDDKLTMKGLVLINADREIKIIDEFKTWSGRTYRYFIWDGIELYINHEKVKAIDPLYVHTAKTGFEGDPVAKEVTPIKLMWSVSSIDRPENAPEHSTIVVRLSLLPEEWRQYIGAGNNAEAKARHIPMNEGISIIRNHREVFYGHIPYFEPKFEAPDRFWGGEISFDAVLDRSFTVKNVKRGALPCVELREALNERIKPTRKEFLKEITKFFQKHKQDKFHADLRAEEGETATGHELAEKVAAMTPTDKNNLDRDKNLIHESSKLAEDIGKGKTDEIKQAWRVKFSSQPFTICDDHWRGSDFFETNHLGGADVLKYNFNHPFFQELQVIIDEISQSILVDEENENEEEQEYKSLKGQKLYRKLKAFIDLLLISYSKAETKFEEGVKMTSEVFIEDLRNNWGQYLKQYVTAWKNEINSKDN